MRTQAGTSVRRGPASGDHQQRGRYLLVLPHRQGRSGFRPRQRRLAPYDGLDAPRDSETGQEVVRSFDGGSVRLMGDLVQLPVRFAGLLSKRELGRAISRSPRWIELMQRDYGLPYTRDPDTGYCRYDLEAVRAW